MSKKNDCIKGNAGIEDTGNSQNSILLLLVNEYKVCKDYNYGLIIW